MTEKDRWPTLDVEERKAKIIMELVAIDLLQTDPSFWRNYVREMAITSDPTDRMRLDLQMFNRVGQLRQEGKMKPSGELDAIALGMVDMSSDEMRKAFSDFMLKK